MTHHLGEIKVDATNEMINFNRFEREVLVRIVWLGFIS